MRQGAKPGLLFQSDSTGCLFSGGDVGEDVGGDVGRDDAFIAP